MKRSTTGKPLSTAQKRLWSAAQGTAFVAALAVIAGLVVYPDWTLRLAWFGVVPLLPASFLVNAGLWRGICPIATANALGPKKGARAMDGSTLKVLLSVGMVLLVVLIAGRRLVLNTQGPVLAGLLLAIVAAAFVLGRIFRSKAGFCNSVCPVLPVEKLYGQSPLLHVRNPRCVPCDLCSTKGCLDIDPVRAVAPETQSLDWMKTPFGLFSIAFPGVILGYFLTSDYPGASALAVAGSIFGGGLASLGVLGSLTLVLSSVFRLQVRVVVVVLGALSVGTYYWFAAPASVRAFGGPDAAGLLLRTALLLLIAVWLVVALRRARTSIDAGRLHTA